MARKRKMKRRTRRKQGISLLGLAETVALANVATQTAFNVNALQFLTAEHSTISGQSVFGRPDQITLRELFNPKQITGFQQTQQQGRLSTSTTPTFGATTDIVMANLKANATSGIIGMITVPLTFKLIKNLGRPAISKINATLRKAGVASTVRV